MAMRQQRDDSSPLTLAKRQRVRSGLIAWCKSCSRRVEPDPAELVERHGEQMTVIEWAARLHYSRCGAHDADFVGTGSRR
jgi:hypothetical protein